jgi:hypothetical protein
MARMGDAGGDLEGIDSGGTEFAATSPETDTLARLRAEIFLFVSGTAKVRHHEIALFNKFFPMPLREVSGPPLWVCCV